jgi:hypothetical protein
MIFSEYWNSFIAPFPVLAISTAFTIPLWKFSNEIFNFFFEDPVSTGTNYYL